MHRPPFKEGESALKIKEDKPPTVKVCLIPSDIITYIDNICNM